MKMLKPAMILFRNCKCGIKIGRKRNLVDLDLSIVSITSSCTACMYPHGPVSDTPCGTYDYVSETPYYDSYDHVSETPCCGSYDHVSETPYCGSYDHVSETTYTGS
jgi:hypothetical protein